jgi:GNAT superfamily N-acetyltransferase
METGGERIDRPWGSIVRNLRFPRIYMANAACVDRTPEDGVNVVLSELDEVFGDTKVRHRNLVFQDAQDAFQQQDFLAGKGFQPLSDLAMARLGLPRCITNPDLDLREVGPTESVDAYHQLRRALHAAAGYDAEESEQLLAVERERAKILSWRPFVAYLRGEPAGTISIWPRGGYALLEDVFTHPRFRMQGVARTMLFQASKLALRAGAEWTVLITNLLDTPRLMYQTLGFVPVGEIRSFLSVPASAGGPNLM